MADEMESQKCFDYIDAFAQLITPLFPIVSQKRSHAESKVITAGLVQADAKPGGNLCSVLISHVKIILFR